MALWSGRFEQGVSEFTQEFGASLPIDKAMYHQDIAGSRAHARMLAAQGVISEEDKQKIVDGLTAIEKRIDEGDFVFDINDEDIHMSIEKVLTENIGDAGARLHTGRSRNDQVVTDTRLYAKELARELMVANVSLREALFEAAEKTFGVILPGYTHMQHAQPVLLSHHFMAYFWMFSRDFKRLSAALDAADMNRLSFSSQNTVSLALILVIADHRTYQGHGIIFKQHGRRFLQPPFLQSLDHHGNRGVDRTALLTHGLFAL